MLPQNLCILPQLLPVDLVEPGQERLVHAAVARGSRGCGLVILGGQFARVTRRGLRILGRGVRPDDAGGLDHLSGRGARAAPVLQAKEEGLDEPVLHVDAQGRVHHDLNEIPLASVPARGGLAAQDARHDEVRDVHPEGTRKVLGRVKHETHRASPALIDVALVCQDAHAHTTQDALDDGPEARGHEAALLGHGCVGPWRKRYILSSAPTGGCAA
mmetsp:Transcript_98658/g.307369  ORF Transcript_98658/g.307369 Transcript_98658/m.307369 type:complete len:215 (+) Transcript_98658:1135-1779(+)